MEGLTCMGDGETPDLKEGTLFSWERPKPGDPLLKLGTVGHSPSPRQERPLNVWSPVAESGRPGPLLCSIPHPLITAIFTPFERSHNVRGHMCHDDAQSLGFWVHFLLLLILFFGCNGILLRKSL